MSDVIFQRMDLISCCFSSFNKMPYICFPGYHPQKAFSSMFLLCVVSLFLKAEEYEHYEKFISEFHESQLNDLKSRINQSSEKDIKTMCSVTHLKDKCFRCIWPWQSNRNLPINIIPHHCFKTRSVYLHAAHFILICLYFSPQVQNNKGI